MTTESVAPIETLGQRLHRQGVRLMSAHTPTFAWLVPVQELLEHVLSLPGSTAGRFDRIEPDGLVAGFHDWMTPSRKAIDRDGEPAPGRPLPGDVQAQVRRVTGRDASAMRVHVDGAGDRVARAHRADAVTVGRDVYFRQGRFRPRDPHGLGLVAHEATHVAELFAPGGAWRRLTRGGQLDEERRAAANERRAALDGRADSAATPTPPQRFSRHRPEVVGVVAVTPRADQHIFSSSSPPPMQASTPPALQPMLAAEERTADTPSPLDVEALRRSLFQDLKDQLRTEFERGA
jgi:hypothetical protein